MHAYTVHVTDTDRTDALAPRARGPVAPAADDISLATMLCFDLYSASRAMTSVYRGLLDPVGLTYPQYLVLVVLWTRGEQTVRQVIDLLHLDYGTVSPLLKRLEARGLVARRRRTDDERSVLVTLTDEGRALRARVAHVPGRIGAAFGLDVDDQATLARLLATVTASATASTDADAGTPPPADPGA